MKKFAFAVAAAAVSLMLAACDSPSQPDNDTPPVIQPDKDCTHGDGKPC